MTLGVVLVLAALCLFLYNQLQSKKAESFTDSVMERMLLQIEEKDRQETAQKEMTVKEIDGYGYVGYLKIPSLDLKLPVMSACDERRLKISPCRYAGSTFTNDLVIAAHNYRSHFGRLKTLKLNDKVRFIDMDGNKTDYLVREIQTLSPFSVAEMTAGIYDMTLFTCTPGGRTRVTIRCDRVDG